MTATRVLVLNSGSSSLKYQLLDMRDASRLALGLVERIGEQTSRLKHTCVGIGETREQNGPIADHDAALKAVAEELARDGIGLDSPDLLAIGHRVVHGGMFFTEPTVIDDGVITEIERLIPVAPLHNPANLTGIRTARALRPDLPQVAVFDTAFHTTMPESSARYAIDPRLADRYRVRRYGFHGTSHRFVAGECARLLGRPLAECNLITVHLGNGCSMTAIENGVSIDTSLGMTPLEGLVMGTRSGDVDPALHLFLKQNKGMELEAIDDLLNKESGLKGLCGMNDMRDIHRAAEAGDRRAALALEVQTYRNRKYLGAYMAVLGRVDAIVFTAGIGENDAVVRAESLRGLEHLGVVLDAERNTERSREARCISSPESRVRVFVIPTNEELAIGRETVAVVAGQGQ